MTLRVPGANGTASHRGRNASTPTSAFALHENEPPPFPARSTNSPSCRSRPIRYFVSPLSFFPVAPSHNILITLASTTPISVPLIHRMSVYRFISANLLGPFNPRYCTILRIPNSVLIEKFREATSNARLSFFSRSMALAYVYVYALNGSPSLERERGRGGDGMPPP